MDTHNSFERAGRALRVLLAVLPALILVAALANADGRNGKWRATELQLLNVSAQTRPVTATWYAASGEQAWFRADVLPSGRGNFYIPALPDEFSGTVHLDQAKPLPGVITHFQDDLNPPGAAQWPLVDGDEASTVAYVPYFASNAPPVSRARMRVYQDPPDQVEPLVLEELASAGRTDYFVWMAEKADLSTAAGLTSKEAKGRYVYEALRATAERTQRELRAYLDQQGVEYTAYYIANKILVRGGDSALLSTLAARPDVARITANHTYQLQEPFESVAPPADALVVEPNIAFINADDAWAMGVTGQGTVMAGNDTGLDETHPAIARHYRGCIDPPACTTWNHNYNWWDATGTYPTNPWDGHGHGTHTTGTMVGDDGGTNQIGVAPGAKTVHCKNMTDGGSGSEDTFTECFQWDLAPWDLNGLNPRPDLAPDAINNSWGYWGGGQQQFEDEIAALQAAGIAVQVSAGGEGPGCMTLRSPADYEQVLTTGSVDQSGGVLPGILSSFSARGPSSLYPGAYFPDIVAPGINVRSSLPNNGYGVWSGTSMAGPHATALIGLIWSANPALRGQVEMTYQIIKDTAVPLTGQSGSNCGGDYVTGPNNDWGYGTIDAAAAAALALAMEVAPPLQLSIHNLEDATAVITVTFYDASGGLAHTWLGGVVPPRGALFVTGAEMGVPAGEFSAVVRANRKIYVGVDRMQGEAFAASQGAACGGYKIVAPLFMAEYPYGYDHLNTVLALQNASPVTATGVLSYYEAASGDWLAGQSFELAPYAALHWSAPPAVAGTLGHVVATANQPLAGLALGSGGALPATELWDYAAVAVEPEQPGGFNRRVAYGPVVYSHYADWTSQVHIANLSDEPAWITITYTSVPTGVIVALLPQSVPPHAMLVSSAMYDMARAAVQVESSQPLAAAVWTVNSPPGPGFDHYMAYEAAYDVLGMGGSFELGFTPEITSVYAIAVHAVVVTNTGGALATYALTTDSVWPVEKSASILWLGAGLSATVMLTVEIPAGAPAYATDVMTLTVAPQGGEPASVALATHTGCRFNFDLNSLVDMVDLVIILPGLGSASPYFDMNHDGAADIADIVVVLGRFGASCP